MIEVLITSSVLIAVIALLRLVLREHIRPGLQYALWGLVLLRLLVPVSWFQSPVSVAGAAETAIEEVESLSVRPVSELSAYFIPALPDAPAVEREASLWDNISLESLAIALWITGAILLGLWFAFVNLRLAGKLYRERRLYSTDYPAAVYVVRSLPSPCLFAGEVYLTEEASHDPARAEYIIAHELTHRRHGDGLWSALRVCCLAVYWFNPFVWLAATLSRRDCEIFCDASTVKKLGEEHRFDYGRTLLDMTAVKLRPADLICSATTMSGSGRTLRERIRLIARQPRVSAALCAVVVLIAALTVGFTFSGTSEAVELSSLMPEPTATSEPETAGEPIRTYDEEYQEELGFPVPTTSPEEAQATSAPTAPAQAQEAAVDTYEDTSVTFDYEAFEDNHSFVAPWDSTSAPKATSTPTPVLSESHTAILDSVQTQIESSSSSGSATTKLPVGATGTAVSTPAPAPVTASATDLPQLQPPTPTDLEETETVSPG